jgi:hypothetical protein
MGYFSNSSEYCAYKDRWCANCLNNTENGCPIMDTHLLFGGGHQAAQVVLNHLIPEAKDGLSNERCTMFRAKGQPRRLKLIGSLSALPSNQVEKAIA